jgi:hypothetical protein
MLRLHTDRTIRSSDEDIPATSDLANLSQSSKLAVDCSSYDD